MRMTIGQWPSDFFFRFCFDVLLPRRRFFSCTKLCFVPPFAVCTAWMRSHDSDTLQLARERMSHARVLEMWTNVLVWQFIDAQCCMPKCQWPCEIALDGNELKLRILSGFRLVFIWNNAISLKSQASTVTPEPSFWPHQIWLIDFSLSLLS